MMLTVVILSGNEVYIHMNNATNTHQEQFTVNYGLYLYPTFPFLCLYEHKAFFVLFLPQFRHTLIE